MKAKPPALPHWLFVDLAENFGGHEVMILRWIEELVRAQTVVPLLMCVEGSRLALLARPICQTVELRRNAPSRANKLHAVRQVLGVVRLMGRAVWQWRPKVVVVGEGCLMAQRHGLMAAVLLRQFVVLYVPLVSRFEAMGFPDAERLERRMKSFYGKLPSAWLTITPEQASELREWSHVQQPVHCLPNTVSAAIESNLARRLHQAPAQAGVRTKVLVLGRLEPWQKGLDLLLAHLIAHPELGQRFEVRLVGEGPYSEDLHAALAAYPVLAGCLKLAPWSDATELLLTHDVLLLPSRYEGVPLVMLEAMALGLPVVASDLPGTRSYLPQDCLFAVGDLTRAFDILIRLHESNGAWRQVAESNVRVFREQASGAAFGAAVTRLAASMRRSIR